MPDPHAVYQVSNDSAKNQAERNLSTHGMDIEMMPSPDKDHERAKSHHCQNPVITPKHAPGSARVAPVDQFEKAVDHRHLLRKSQIFQDNQLRDLVEKHDHEREHCDSPIGTGLSHPEKFVADSAKRPLFPRASHATPVCQDGTPQLENRFRGSYW